AVSEQGPCGSDEPQHANRHPCGYSFHCPTRRVDERGPYGLRNQADQRSDRLRLEHLRGARPTFRITREEQRKGIPHHHDDLLVQVRPEVAGRLVVQHPGTLAQDRHDADPPQRELERVILAAIGAELLGKPLTALVEMLACKMPSPRSETAGSPAVPDS